MKACACRLRSGICRQQDKLRDVFNLIPDFVAGVVSGPLSPVTSLRMGRLPYLKIW
jgi:hypothetical protein